jgi:hypothetical protein
MGKTEYSNQRQTQPDYWRAFCTKKIIFGKSPGITQYLLAQIVYGAHLQVIAFVNCQEPDKVK